MKILKIALFSYVAPFAAASKGATLRNSLRDNEDSGRFLQDLSLSVDMIGRGGSRLSKAWPSKSKSKTSKSSSGSASTTSRISDDGTSIRVMTRNMYAGANLNKLVEGDIGTVLQQFIATDYPNARSGALAKEICDARPDLIGLQEAALVSFAFANGETSDVQFVPILLAQISSTCGMTYSVQAESKNFGLFGIPIDGDGSTVSLQDTDVILVNDDNEFLRITKSEVGDFSAAPVIPLPGGSLALTRGWSYVDALSKGRKSKGRKSKGRKSKGRKIRFANTHFESTSEEINQAQAREFLEDVVARTPRGLGLVAVGDFNCLPDSLSYDDLVGELSDAWDVNGGEDGFTFGQNAWLNNTRSEFFERIDYVFYRESKKDEFNVESAHLVGDVRFRDTQPPYWASDHAGVVVDFTITPAARKRSRRGL